MSQSPSLTPYSKAHKGASQRQIRSRRRGRRLDIPTPIRLCPLSLPSRRNQRLAETSPPMFRRHNARRIHRIPRIRPPRLFRRRIPHPLARSQAVERHWLWRLCLLWQRSRTRSKNRTMDERRRLRGRVSRTIPSTDWTVAERHTFSALACSSSIEFGLMRSFRKQSGPGIWCRLKTDWRGFRFDS